jgi:hypothetical protein
LLTANAALAAWGVYAKKPELVELARHRYQQFKAILTRRGFASEFNSPAYTFLQLALDCIFSRKIAVF